MPIQQQHYQITGMKQDNLVGTGFSNKFAHEIKNMRLNTIGDYTTGVWTTEKGTKSISPLMSTSELYKVREKATLSSNFIVNYFPIKGARNILGFNENSPLDLRTFIALGEATINDQWILFGKISYQNNLQTLTTDCILRMFYINANSELRCEVLYFGNLQFDIKYPIETLSYYENENIQKVYFTDGKNQPRVINVANVKRRFIENSIETRIPKETQFDFVREVALKEDITIEKLQSGAGLFPPCTVKYAITYYDKYGQESNIIYDSPLYYPTKGERGCTADELSSDSFEITVRNLDKNFDYIRLYSIVRTSEDATPIVRIISDKRVSDANRDTSTNIDYVTFIDTNTTGEIIDPNVLKFVGGHTITAQTFDQKTNTMFLGNIEIITKSASSVLGIYEDAESFNPQVGWSFSNIKQRSFDLRNSYPYKNQLNPTSNDIEHTNDYSSQGIKHFKEGEEYCFGLQFQDKYGIWSEVVSTSNMKSITPQGLSIVQDDDNGSATVQFQIPSITLTSTVVNSLYDEDYRKVRLVRAKKDNSNRKILAQGVIDSTVYEQRTRGENGPYAMASWFFRPKECMYKAYNINPSLRYSFGEDGFDMFSYRQIVNRNGVSLSTGSGFNWNEMYDFHDNYVEIQNMVSQDALPSWHVDRDILTYHSPELEFDDSLATLDYSKINFKIVGIVPVDNSTSSYHVSADFAPISGTIGLTEKSFSFNDTLPKTHEVNSSVTYESSDKTWAALLYPFQNADMGGDRGYTYKVYGSMLTSKMTVFSNTTLILKNESDHTKTYWQIPSDVWTKDNCNLKPEYYSLFEKDGVNMLRIPITKDNVTYYDQGYNQLTKTLTQLIYFGNINMIAPSNKQGKYPIYQDEDSDRTTSTKPIGLNYKTSTHGVIALAKGVAKDSSNLRWEDIEEEKEPFNIGKPYLWIVNLEKEINEDRNVDTEVFIPCGPSYELTKNSSVTVYGLEGDHYFMRYDCLKTFPYTLQDRNQIVEILSFMCETRVNLDGRCDTNRGLTDNTTVTDTNFNIINKSYTQDNDFFFYTTLDKQSATLDKFANQFTYTSVKIAGEDIDAWTNITLSNIDNAEGTCGQITKIKNIADKLFLFQEHGIARINYDEKTTLTTDTGIPIELNSTGKYTGLDYTSKEIGCQNKWSISCTKNGLFWIDDSRRELLTMDENFTSVTTLNGLDSFMINNSNQNFSWTPNFGLESNDGLNRDNFITFYDKLSKDIYFVNSKISLAWNEISKTFTSFYDYNKIDALTTINNHTLMFRYKDGVYAARENANYSYFFKEYKPYWITLVCDGSSEQNNNFALDKVFNTIEYRADIYNLDGDNTNYANTVFDIKRAWNGYQDSQEVTLNGERKFNTWRVQLPRHYGTRDRIRNPFCYITLKQNQTQTDRIILHDLMVSYSIK